MKKTFKLLAMALFAIAITTSLSSCGGGGGSDDDGGSTPSPVTPTPSTNPSVTGTATGISSVGATLNCQINKNGVAANSVGVYVSTTPTPSKDANALSGNPKSLSGTNYSVTFSGLRENTKYYYCSLYYDGKSYYYGDVKSFTTNSITHTVVDLGLTSGTQWATTNVGAEKPEDAGNYFEWETTIPMGYTKATNTQKISEGMSLLDVDENGDIVVDPAGYALSIDQAYMFWGENWRTPTDAQVKELIEECKWTWCDGVNTKYGSTSAKGYIVKSKKNSNSIFLPAAGQRTSATSTQKEGEVGLYRTRPSVKVETTNSSYLVFNSTLNIRCEPNVKTLGATVRPVANN